MTENKNEQAPGTQLIVSQELADKLQPLTESEILDGKIVGFEPEGKMVEFQRESNDRMYHEGNFVGGHTSGEMTPEEQQAILRQIIQSTKTKGLNKFLGKSKTVNVDADKKRKAKNKAAKKSRKLNHKKKK